MYLCARKFSECMGKFKGVLYGMATSVTFGLIPLFTLPLIGKGMGYDSILFYRFLFASVALACVMLARRESFRIEAKDIPTFVLLAVFYTFSSLFLLSGYGYMGAGVATTLHFTYPVFVTLLMFLLFREKTSWLTWLAIALAVGGVAMLSLPSTGMRADIRGVIIVLLSAVAYGSYIVGVNKSRVRNMNSRKLAFYVFVITTLIFGAKDLAAGSLQLPPDPSSVGCLILLAVLPTVVSNITLVLAVQNIDSGVRRGIGVRRGLHVARRFRHPACAFRGHGDNPFGHYPAHPRQSLPQDPPEAFVSLQPSENLAAVVLGVHLADGVENGAVAVDHIGRAQCADGLPAHELLRAPGFVGLEYRAFGV